MHHIIIFGNAGSGKSTLAKALSHNGNLAHLDLDLVAWDEKGQRRPLSESRAAILSFMDREAAWVMEGCYADLLEVALPCCPVMIFLNPGTETCIANSRTRPWEPEKYPSKEAQDENLPFLLDWIREYEHRDDEYSLIQHRRLFEQYPGPKYELTDLSDPSFPVRLGIVPENNG